MPIQKNKGPAPAAGAPAVHHISILRLLCKAAIVALAIAVLFAFIWAGTSLSAGRSFRDVPVVLAIGFGYGFVSYIALLLYASITSAKDQRPPPEPKDE